MVVDGGRREVGAAGGGDDVAVVDGGRVTDRSNHDIAADDDPVSALLLPNFALRSKHGVCLFQDADLTTAGGLHCTHCPPPTHTLLGQVSPLGARLLVFKQTPRCVFQNANRNVLTALPTPSQS